MVHIKILKCIEFWEILIKTLANYRFSGGGKEQETIDVIFINSFLKKKKKKLGVNTKQDHIWKAEQREKNQNRKMLSRKSTAAPRRCQLQEEDSARNREEKSPDPYTDFKLMLLWAPSPHPKSRTKLLIHLWCWEMSVYGKQTNHEWGLVQA